MKTHPQESRSNSSPWTDMYDMHCSREEAKAFDMSMADHQAEIEPTLEALADVYNRDDAVNMSKRF